MNGRGDVRQNQIVWRRVNHADVFIVRYIAIESCPSAGDDGATPERAGGDNRVAGERGNVARDHAAESDINRRRRQPKKHLHT